MEVFLINWFYLEKYTSNIKGLNRFFFIVRWNQSLSDYIKDIQKWIAIFQVGFVCAQELRVQILDHLLKEP